MLLTCLTPLVLKTLGDPTNSPDDPRLRFAPSGIGVRPDVAAPPDAKPWYGTPYSNSVTTEHFGLTWRDGDADDDQAARAAAALEAAWTELIDVQGWPEPVSADSYLLWILLVDDISATGYTTEYHTDEYPDGYPVIYLNTKMAGDEGFWTTLASHEFHHAVQYAMRDFGAGASSESWYWEASATWAANLVEPDTAALDYISAWYARNSAEPYTSTDGSHQYGMFVFNAWLETGGLTGPGTMLGAWEASATMAGASWREILEASTGFPAETLWSGFASGYGNEEYWRTDSWFDPDKARLVAGRNLEGGADELGTAYYLAPQQVEVEVTALDGGAFQVAYPAEDEVSVGRWRVPAGMTVTVTATEAGGATWEIAVSEVTEDTGGETDTGGGGVSGEPADTGGSGDTAVDDGDSGQKLAGPQTPAGCGCGSPGSPAAAAAALSLATLLRRRNRRSRAGSIAMR
jgi:uncharacterized protein (TIGR03382 family)